MTNISGAQEKILRQRQRAYYPALILDKRWRQFFFSQALAHLQMSKDPSTRCGAVIVSPELSTLCGGFNGFPRHLLDSDSRLKDRALKHKLIVHAEMNAVLVAARRGICIEGCSLFLLVQSTDGIFWGGPPCTRCLIEMIQAGISEVITLAPPPEEEIKSWLQSRGYTTSWLEDYALSREIMQECGVHYSEIPRKELI